MKLQAQFLTSVFLRKFSTSWKFYAKLEVLPKRSLVDERLQTTIISNLKPRSSGTYILTAKRILKRLGKQTSSSFVKI